MNQKVKYVANNKVQSYKFSPPSSLYIILNDSMSDKNVNFVQTLEWLYEFKVQVRR